MSEDASYGILYMFKEYMWLLESCWKVNEVSVTFFLSP